MKPALALLLPLFLAVHSEALCPVVLPPVVVCEPHCSAARPTITETVTTTSITVVPPTCPTAAIAKREPEPAVIPTCGPVLTTTTIACRWCTKFPVTATKTTTAVETVTSGIIECPLITAPAPTPTP